jgi:hypothetical protein
MIRFNHHSGINIVGGASTETAPTAFSGIGLSAEP